MDIILNRLLYRFCRCLKQGADIHIKTHIGESGRNDLGTAIMAILPQFDHQQTGATTLPVRAKAVTFCCNRLKLFHRRHTLRYRLHRSTGSPPD